MHLMFLTLHDVRKRTDKELFAFVPEPDAKKQGFVGRAPDGRVAIEGRFTRFYERRRHWVLWDLHRLRTQPCHLR